MSINIIMFLMSIKVKRFFFCCLFRLPQNYYDRCFKCNLVNNRLYEIWHSDLRNTCVTPRIYAL